MSRSVNLRTLSYVPPRNLPKPGKETVTMYSAGSILSVCNDVLDIDRLTNIADKLVVLNAIADVVEFLYHFARSHIPNLLNDLHGLFLLLNHFSRDFRYLHAADNKFFCFPLGLLLCVILKSVIDFFLVAAEQLPDLTCGVTFIL